MNSNIPFEVTAAVRFLREGILQTLLIVVGVAVGVSVIVFMSALINSLQSNLMARVLSGQAQIVLSPPKQSARPMLQLGPNSVVRVVQTRVQQQTSIDQWIKLRAILSQMPEINAVSPMASGAALITRGSATRSISLLGIDPDNYYRIVNIPADMVEGTSRISGQDALIGKDLAEDIGLRTGDKLHVSNASGTNRTLTISGIYDLGNKGANLRNVIVTLNTAQGLVDLVGGVSSIDVNLKDAYAADAVADRIVSAHAVKADSWIKTNAQFFTAMNAQTISMTTIRLSVALSVALGIASVLVVSVVQRTKEIGILRAMGASQGQVLRLFLVQGGIVGLLGSIGGVLLARLMLVFWVLLARNPDGTNFFAIEITPAIYAWTAVLATAAGILAAAMPAINAARLDPVVAIRG